MYQVNQIATEALEQFRQALEAGHSGRLKEYLAAMARFHRYSLRNVMLIASQKPVFDDLYCGCFAVGQYKAA